ncbi:MAG: cupin domain-containing protein [Acidobacteria bacterium]|nr:MAG: cupin domain-containing protein [Acidobacteriota bacterium]
MKIRCVVTGRDPVGKSVVAKDAAIEPVTLSLLPGFEFHRIWGGDAVPKLPSDGTPPAHPRYFPPPSGFRFVFFTVPPNSHKLPENTDLAEAFGELHEKLPGLAEVMEPMNPGMHTTETVDFDVILSGEVYLELDDGVETLLKAGDCVVQNGTRHGWHNRSSQNCVVAVAIVGADHVR